MRTIIIGLGNPLLGDDGIGWKVAEEVSKQLSENSLQPGASRQPSAVSSQLFPDTSKEANRPDQLPTTKNQQSTTNCQSPTANRQLLEFDFLSLGGLSLMERLIDYDRAILIDAISTGKNPPGTVYSLRLEELPDFSAHHTASAHDASLQTALRLGREMGAHLPEEVLVVAIEAQKVYEFTEELTPAVATALPEAVGRVMELLTTDF